MGHKRAFKASETFELSPAIRHRNIDGCTVIVDQQQNLIMELNESASFIFQHIQSGLPRAEIAKLLSLEYEVNTENALQDIKELLRSLLERNIIICESEVV